MTVEADRVRRDQRRQAGDTRRATQRKTREQLAAQRKKP